MGCHINAGDMIGESSRGRGAGRGICGHRYVTYSCRARRPRRVHIASYHSPSEADQLSSNESTQPPSQPWEPLCRIPMAPHKPNREPSFVREPPPNGDNISMVVSTPNGDNTGIVFTPPNRDNIGTVVTPPNIDNISTIVLFVLCSL